MAPLVAKLNEASGIQHFCCITGQHRQMLDQILKTFEIKPDDDLKLMAEDQTLGGLTSLALDGITAVIAKRKPDWILVQGDTTTAFAGALAAFYNKVKIGHVEAGLRTGNLASPWPEEGNRKLISAISNLHFAPTSAAAANLRLENIALEDIHVTGNTVIDALQIIAGRIATDGDLHRKIAERFSFLDGRRLILATGHRRENFQNGALLNMCEGLKQIAKRGDVQIIYPVHLNPNVQEQVRGVLSTIDNVHLVEPLDYQAFVFLLLKCYFVVTDSGGIQEEAPALGKPVLVMRDTTERPEAIAAGTAKLVGTRKDELIRCATLLLESERDYNAMALASNPFGDGKASSRIVDVLLSTRNS